MKKEDPPAMNPAVIVGITLAVAAGIAGALFLAFGGKKSAQGTPDESAGGEPVREK